MKRKNLVMIVIVFALMGLNVSAQQLMFQKTYGGTSNDQGSCVQQTTDGGYIITGWTSSFGAGNWDVYLIKTNPYGDTLWTKTFGGINDDYGFSVMQTTDMGYIIAGSTISFGSGDYDVYLIKTDSIGDTLWTKTYGGTNVDGAYSVQQTTDGGYILVGSTTSFGAGNNDVYLIKTNNSGDTLWTRIYGGTGDDEGYSVKQTTDNGYIIAGYSASFGAGNYDVILIKSDSLGGVLWKKTFGGIDLDEVFSIHQTTDGGYIITGSTYSYGAGNIDIYLIKTNASGDTTFTKTFGGTNNDAGSSVQQTTDGGYVIIGYTSSFGAGGKDVYLIKTNADGDTIWTKTFGGTGDDVGSSVQQTIDGGYILAGRTNSFGSGGNDVYLIKTDANGNSGCNQGNPSTTQGSTTTQTSSPLTKVSSGGIINSTITVTGNGGIITNLCTNAGINLINNSSSLLLSPNPFTSATTLTLQGTYHNPSLFIYNLLGQEVRSIPIGTNTQLTINREQLHSGMYFYKVIDENKEVIGIGKMVIE